MKRMSQSCWAMWGHDHESVQAEQDCALVEDHNSFEMHRMMVRTDQDTIQKKSGVIYRYKCDRVECDEEYTGGSSRTFGERFKEHLKVPSPIYDHFNTTGHIVTIENYSIVGREDQNLSRLTKEALCIRVNNPFINRNIGKYHLPHIWGEVLFKTSELKLK